MDSEYLKNLRNCMECVSVDNLVALLLESSRELKEKSPNVHDVILRYLQNSDNLQLMGDKISGLETQITNYESTIASYESAIRDMQITNDELKTMVKNLRAELHGVYKDRKNLQYEIAKLTH